MKIRLFTALAILISLPAIFAADPVLKSGIDKSNFDPAVRPQDDLFRHVNGHWLEEAKIPSDRPADGAFFALRDRSEQQVRAIIEESAKVKGDGDTQKISDLFASFMDEARAD